ncbi:MFS transporter [Actinoallomurus acanthiterrae]
MTASTAHVAAAPRRLSASIVMVGAIAYCVVLATLSAIVPLSVLPNIGASLHASGALLNWAVISSTAASAVATGIFPPLASIFGQRMMLAVAMGAVTVGAALDAVAPSMSVLLIGRIISAFGLGAIALSLAIVRTNMSGRALSLALGCIAGAEGVGAGLAFVFGGLITETVHVGWHAVFWTLAVLGLVATASALTAVPGTGDRVVRRVDWLGGGLLGAALALVLIPLSMGPHWGWGSAKVLGMLILGVVAATAWWAIEDRTDEPMVNTRALRDRTFLLGAGVFLLTAMLVWIMDFTIPAMATAPKSTGFGFGYDALLGGMVMVPMCVGIAAGGIVSGAVARWVPARALGLLSFVVAILSMVLLAVAHGAEWQLWVWPALFGVSYGMGVACAYMTFIGALRPEQVATAAAIGQTAGPIGAAVASAGITAILTAHVIKAGPIAVPTEHSFQTGWWIGAGIAVLGAVCALAIRGPRTAHRA